MSCSSLGKCSFRCLTVWPSRLAIRLQRLQKHARHAKVCCSNDSLPNVPVAPAPSGFGSGVQMFETVGIREQ